jgi:hypothetical protein
LNENEWVGRYSCHMCGSDIENVIVKVSEMIILVVRHARIVAFRIVEAKSRRRLLSAQCLCGTETLIL